MSLSPSGGNTPIRDSGTSIHPNHSNYNPATDFMQQCFFIFDDLGEQDEKAPEEDLILFFYPNHNFQPDHPLEITKLERSKLAIKPIGNITMVLSGAADDPDSTVIGHLNLVYAAFKFYNRSFPSVIEQCRGSRKELIKEMGRIGKELIPLITQCFHKNLLSSFNALPYTPLPHKANRSFIQASQLLNSIKMDPNNLSGTVFYRNRCFDYSLDFKPPRIYSMYWALGSCRDVKSSSAPGFGSPFTPRELRRVEPRSDLLSIYMHRNEVDKLIKERNNMFPPSASSAGYGQSPFGASLRESRNANEEQNAWGDVLSKAVDVQSTDFTYIRKVSIQKVKKSPYKLEEEDADGYIQLGLYILSLNELSVAIVLKFHALYDKEHMKKFLKLTTDPKLQQLEADLDAIGQQPGQTTILMNNARIVPSTSYHLVTYDNQTELATSTSIMNPAECEFSRTASNIHDTFVRDANTKNPPHMQVSQVILRDSNGEIYARKAFGKEVFFQYKNSNNISHDKFLEGIEKAVRTTLKEEHNINIL